MSLNHVLNTELGLRAGLKVGCRDLQIKLDGDEGILNMKPKTLGYNNQILVSDGQGGVKFEYIESGVYIGIKNSLYIMNSNIPTSILPLQSIGSLTLPDRRIGSCYSLELAGNLFNQDAYQEIKFIFLSGDNIISESNYMSLTDSDETARWTTTLKIIFRNENIENTEVCTQSDFHYIRSDGTLTETINWGGVTTTNLTGDLDIKIKFKKAVPNSTIESDFCLLSKLN